METLTKLVRAPFFFGGLLISMIPVFFIFAAVSVGAWIEVALRGLGYRSRPAWLPMVLGLVSYAGLGLVGPAYLGNQLLGWPGAVGAPLLILGTIAIVGRW